VPIITPFLSGNHFDPETRRVIGIAFELTCRALRIVDADDHAYQAIASKIIEGAKAGELDPNTLCDQTLHEIRTPPGLWNFREAMRAATEEKLSP
jgi:hypothetical protein